MKPIANVEPVANVEPIVILEHSPEVPPGYLADAITWADLEAHTVRLYAGDPLPGLNQLGAVVSLGGVMGAYDDDEHPFLVAEKVYLREAVALGIPVLGICLGCQMLAEALGGRAFLAGQVEVGFAGLRLEAGGAADPVVGTLASPVVSFHQDTWEPPPGATVLATSDRYPHAFRLGSALAIQSHPEASPEIVDRWVEGFGRDRLEQAGVDPDAFLASVRRGAVGNENRATELFRAWLREVELRSRTA
jgi:GMP synthase (glutamine-hydrolysing)